MTESAVIDLRDRKNPPPDDPVNAPYGFRWDTKKREWIAKRSAGGRKAGSAWFGKKEPDPEPEPEETSSSGEYFRGTRYEDPTPAHMTAKAPKLPKAPVRVTKKAKDDMAGAIGMIGMVALPFVQSRDPYCGQVLTENYQNIADAVIPLLCKSSAVVDFFSGEHGDWLLWIQLLTAVAPVAVAIGKHHIFRTVEIRQDEETGELYAMPADFAGYSTEEFEDAADGT